MWCIRRYYHIKFPKVNWQQFYEYQKAIYRKYLELNLRIIKDYLRNLRFQKELFSLGVK